MRCNKARQKLLNKQHKFFVFFVWLSILFSADVMQIVKMLNHVKLCVKKFNFLYKNEYIV